MKPITVAVHYTENLRDDNFAHRWIKLLKKQSINVIPLDLKKESSLEEIKKCDGVLWHWSHNPDDKQSAHKILNTIESVLKIPVFPNFSTAWHYDEKVSQHYMFKALKIPAITSHVFWDYNEAINFLKTTKYPIVFKLSVGAGSANVLKIDSIKEAGKITREIFDFGIYPYSMNEFSNNLISKLRILKQFIKTTLKRFIYIPPYFIPQKNYAYFQEFLPNNENDIRITIIGDRAFGLIRYNRPGDFRASGSGKFDVTPSNIPLEAVKIAFDLSQKLNFQSMAYDFLLNEDGKPLVNEISYCYANRVVKECPGFWDSDLKWHNHSLWPEEAHIEDFIKTIVDPK